MTIQFLGKKLKNTTVLASGILGNSKDILKRVYDQGCALVTMKSIGPEPRDGHNNPTVVDLGHVSFGALGPFRLLDRRSRRSARAGPGRPDHRQ